MVVVAQEHGQVSKNGTHWRDREPDSLRWCELLKRADVSQSDISKAKAAEERTGL